MKKLQIENIFFKNFMQFGEQGAKVDFTKDKMTLITAPNGAGKSTIIEALVFSLYGKPVRKVTKSELINDRNQKGLYTEICFKCNNKKYKVIRALKPDKFEIYEYKDDNYVLIPQNASSREYQSKLDEKIGMGYNIFIQTVIISKTKYTPFMNLDSAKRRIFVENILNLTIFSDMNKIQKKTMATLKDSLVDAKSNFTLAKNNVDISEKNVERINTLLKESLNERIAYFDNKIATEQSSLAKDNEELERLKKSLFVDSDDIASKNSKDSGILVKLKDKLEELKNTTVDDVCSKCGHDLNADEVKEQKYELSRKITRVSKGIEELTAKIESYQPVLAKIEANVELENNIAMLESSCYNTKNNITQFEKEKNNIAVDDTELENAKLELKNFRDKYNKSNTHLSDIKTDFEHNALVYEMLKDTGIKASIVDKSIPLINHTINRNLSNFGFFVDFKLDKEFNEIIKVRNIVDRKYDSFSEGEKLRMDMAILLAWIEIAQLYSNLSCNLIFFDEMTEASLDSEGSEVLGEMLNELKDTHIFIITHKPENLENLANNTLTIEIEQGYSKLL